MSWLTVIILSVACGIIPGLLMIPDFLIGTSLQQPGTTFEFWVFMALFIALNCEKPVEAGLKTFVFFLISQPLIYLVQVPFSWQGWGLFGYYPLWGILTLFTLPGGMLAWYTKKGNWLSVVILSLANLVLCCELSAFFLNMFKSFPKLIIAVLFIVFELVFFNLLLFKDKKKRILAGAIALVMLVAVSVYAYSKTVKQEKFTITLEGKAPFHLVDEIESPKIEIEGNEMTVEFENFVGLPVQIVDADGNKTEINLSYFDNKFSWEYAE